MGGSIRQVRSSGGPGGHMRIRYSRWDGSQSVPDLDADEILSAISDDLMADGDLWSALRRMYQRGAQTPQGRMPGLQDLLKRLRKERQQKLDRYDLGSTMEDIQKKLDEILRMERQGIEQRVPPGAERDQKMERLDQMPPSPAGRIRALQSYEFTEPEAKRKFDELLKSLQQQMMQPFLQNMQQGLQNMTPQDLQRMREMMRDLNRMMRDRLNGEEPDFQGFKDKWGQQFPGAESLDDVLEQMGRRMGQMQSLMESLSPEQRQQMQDMMRSLFMQDERLEAEMRQLAANLEQLMPMDSMRQRYEFRGEEETGMREAMELMSELQQMDELERQLRAAQDQDDLQAINPEQVERLLGKETVMNAVGRTGQGTPVRLVPDDFAVYRTEFSTQSATVVMLDLSRSMIYNGCLLPAKKVALALNALIAGQFPRDQLHIIGFSLYAREFKADQIPGLNPSETSIG